MILTVFVAAVAILLVPGKVSAYGGAHVGYTHVGPNGCYHVGATEAHGGYGGGAAYAGGGGSSARAGAYAYGMRGGQGFGPTGTGFGGAGGYSYAAGYSGGAAAGGAHVSYNTDTSAGEREVLWQLKPLQPVFAGVLA
jgi:hypothetical protein